MALNVNYNLAYDYVDSMQLGSLVMLAELVTTFQITRNLAKRILLAKVASGSLITLFRGPCTKGKWVPHILALATIDVVSPDVEVAFERVRKFR